MVDHFVEGRHQRDHRLLGPAHPHADDPRPAQGRRRRVLRGLARARDRLRRCGRPASLTAFEQRSATAYAVPAAGGQAGREDRLQLRLRHQRPRPPRHQPRPHQPLQREPPQAAEGVGEHARPQAARPALRPADRRDAGRALLDIPEGESLGFKNLDDYRRQAGARDLAGNTILSNEAGATAGGAYSTTWETETCASSRRVRAGVNQNVLHGFSLRHLPGARWPGFAAFTPVQGRRRLRRVLGPAPADLEHATDVSGYFARNQLLMQTGRNVVTRRSWRRRATWPRATARRSSPPTRVRRAQVLKDGGTQVGWTNEDISESILDLPNAVVRDTRLAPDGPDFKVLVLEGDVAFSRAILLRVATARKLLDWAKAGLPIVLVGNWSAPSVPGIAKPGENATLKAWSRTAGAADGPQPADQGPDPARAGRARRPARRRVPGRAAGDRPPRRRHHGLLLPRQQLATAATSVDATFAMTDPTAVPYVADAWSGKLTPVANYSVTSGRLKTRRLKAGQTMILVFGHDVAALPQHATATTPTPSAPTARTSSSATPRRHLHHHARRRPRGAGGRSAPSPRVAADAVDARRRRLAAGRDADPDRARAHTLALDGLKAWPDIPELADVSGVGTLHDHVRRGTAAAPTSTSARSSTPTG